MTIAADQITFPVEGEAPQRAAATQTSNIPNGSAGMIMASACFSKEDRAAKKAN